MQPCNYQAPSLINTPIDTKKILTAGAIAAEYTITAVVTIVSTSVSLATSLTTLVAGVAGTIFFGPICLICLPISSIIEPPVTMLAKSLNLAIYGLAKSIQNVAIVALIGIYPVVEGIKFINNLVRSQVSPATNEWITEEFDHNTNQWVRVKA